MLLNWFLDETVGETYQSPISCSVFSPSFHFLTNWKVAVKDNEEKDVLRVLNLYRSWENEQLGHQIESNQ